MANVRIRHAIFRVKSKKVAEAFDVNLEVASGDEAHLGQEGYLAHSDGATTSKVEAQCVIPVAGMEDDLTELPINKIRVRIDYFMGGKNYMIDNATCTTFRVQSQTKTGSLNGTFSFEGGPPVVTSR